MFNKTKDIKILSGVIKCILLLAGLILSSAQAAFKHDPRIDWKTMETAHFLLHYPQENAGFADKLAVIAEEVHSKISPELNWQPKDKTHVVITDQFDSPNGSAQAFPTNTIHIRLTHPTQVEGLLDNHSSYLNTLFTHEYVHTIHVDKVGGNAKRLRNLFGRFDWLLLTSFPNGWQPLWVLEGLATYYESAIEEKSGRGNNSYYRALMRNEVMSGVKPLSQVNQRVTEWPAGSIPYLYGVYFFKFLQKDYGDEAIKKWIEEYSDNVIPFHLNHTSIQAFGKSLTTLWQEYKAYLETEFADEIAQVKSKGITPTQKISNSGFLTGNPKVAPNGDVFFVQADLENQAQLMKLNEQTKQVSSLVKVRGRNFDFHPERGFLFVEAELNNNTNSFNDLYTYDNNSYKKKRLSQGGRYQAASWHPSGQKIAAASFQNGSSKVDILNAKGEVLTNLWQGTNEEVVANIQWSPDGEYLLASVWQNGYWNINLMNAIDGNWQAITQTHHIESKPTFSRDGQSILYIADYDGGLNAYRYERASGEVRQLTNLLGGAISVEEINASGELAITALDKNGFDLYTVANPALSQTINLEQFKLSTSDAFNNKITTQLSNQLPNQIIGSKTAKAYSGLSYLKPKGWFPFINLEDDQTEIGVTGLVADPLNRHRISFNLAYDMQNKWPVGGVSYIYDRWNPMLKLSLLRDAFSLRDANNSLIGFANADEFQAELVWPFLKKDQQWALHLAYLNNLDKTRGSTLINSAEPFELTDERLGVAVSYNSAKQFQRAISKKDGHQLRLVHENGSAFDGEFQGSATTLDWRSYYAIGEKNVLATRLLGVYGEDSIRRFSLGGNSRGFGLSTPSSAAMVATDEVFDRRRYALRGYPSGLSSLRGRRLALLEAEYRFPIARLERGWMAPPIGLKQVSGAMFYNAGSVWDESFDSDEVRQGIGAELHAEVELGYGRPLNLRLGVAHGFDQDGENQVYLNLGGTF